MGQPKVLCRLRLETLTNSTLFQNNFVFSTPMKSSTVSSLPKVKHVILVLSGKGGVGKSTVACRLAYEFFKQGQKVGLLDVDICGPSVPRMMGMEGRTVTASETMGWIPFYTDETKKFCVMSLGFLTKRDEAAILRGPKKTQLIGTFLNGVFWDELDYLIVDTPPGTSDEHLAVLENLKKYKPDGALIVTTPQNVSLLDVRRELTFCKRLALPILGLVENMSGYKCPCCDEITNIFSSGGGQALAEKKKINFVGKIAIDPVLVSAAELETSELSKKFPDSPAVACLKQFVAQKLASATAAASPDPSK